MANNSRSSFDVLSPKTVMNAFKKCLAPSSLYERIFTPRVTLWCMILMALDPSLSLKKVVLKIHSGAADGLISKKLLKLSKKIISKANVALTNARKRLAMTWMLQCLQLTYSKLFKPENHPRYKGLKLVGTDGTTSRVRPFKKVKKSLGASSNQNGEGYWCLLRVCGLFCLKTGLLMSLESDSHRVGEQSLFFRMGQFLKECLLVADANFGIFSVIRSALDAGGHCLVAMSPSRARKVAGKKKFKDMEDLQVTWSPSRHDRLKAGSNTDAFKGRLMVFTRRRRGFRNKTLYLFTTLLDPTLYPAQELREIYDWRWTIEVSIRNIKITLGMKELKSKSAEMARKEWLAAGIAYNLVIGLTLQASATVKGTLAKDFSFSDARVLYISIFAPINYELLREKIIELTAAGRHPKRKKKRPSEPRKVRPKSKVYQQFSGSRAKERSKMRKKGHTKC